MLNLSGIYKHGKDEAQTLQGKLNNPDISKGEVKQISNEADKVIYDVHSITGDLIEGRDRLLGTEHKDPITQHEPFNVSFTRNNDQYVSLEQVELPATNLKF